MVERRRKPTSSLLLLGICHMIFLHFGGGAEDLSRRAVTAPVEGLDSSPVRSAYLC